jgi:hypothetical protein
MKHVADDEFGHWATRDWITPRKRREWENFQRVRTGATDDGRFRRHPRGFLDLESAG